MGLLPDRSLRLAPEHWGNGYAVEALRAAIAWAWSTTDDLEIIAVTQTANEASVRLLATIGMTKASEFEEFGEMQARFSLARP